MAYQYPRNPRMQQVRTLAAAVIAEAIGVGVGIFLFLMSFNMAWLFTGAIGGALCALPFILRYLAMTKERA